MERIDFIWEQLAFLSDNELLDLIRMVAGELGRRVRERPEVKDAEPD